MLSLRTSGIAAFTFSLLLAATAASACDTRYPHLCGAEVESFAQGASNDSATRAAEGKTHASPRRSRVKRSRVSRAQTQDESVEQASAEPRPRYTRSKRGSRAAYSRARRNAKAIAAANDGDKDVSPAAQRRFRALVDPSSMTDNEVETSKRPQADTSLFFPANDARPIEAAPPPPPPPPSPAPAAASDAVGLQGRAAAPEQAVAATATKSQARLLPPQDEPPPDAMASMNWAQTSATGEAVKPAQPPADPFSLRSLMLALGGIVTLASALRLIVGI